jgi:hypothetical protein
MVCATVVVAGQWNSAVAMESRLPENYERSAHLLDIVVRHKFDICKLFLWGTSSVSIIDL